MNISVNSDDLITELRASNGQGDRLWRWDEEWGARFRAFLDRVDVVTFDVFDTAITRLTDAPVDVFALAEAKLVERIGEQARGFALARELAESDARAIARAEGREEIDFDEILAALPRRLPGAGRWRKRIAEAELAAEAEVIRPVPEIVEAVRQARAIGKTVFFVSDMYLPAATISSFLAMCGYPGEIPVIVSSETGRTKASGRQWDVLRERVGAGAGILHVGDDERSDIRSARAHGIAALPFVRARSDRRRGGPLTPAVLPYSRAARQARLHTKSESQTAAQFMRDFGASWGAIVVGSFVQWLEGRVQRFGYEHVLFCARDGWLVQRAWEAAGCGERTGARHSYLHASRLTLNLAMAAAPASNGGLSDCALRFLCYPTGLPLQTLLARSGLLACEALVADAIAALGGARRLVYRQEAQKLRMVLRRHADAALAALTPMREAMLGYLAEKGIAGSRVCMVDIGWHGSLQAGIASLLRELGHEPPLSGFYYGLWPDAQRWRPLAGWMEGAFGNDFLAWKERRGMHNAVALLENLHLAPEGSTIGYRQENGRYRPVLDESEDVVHNAGLVAPFQAGAVTAIAELFETGRSGALSLEDLSLEAGLAAIDRVALSPSAKELEVLGTIRHAQDFAHTVYAPLIPPGGPGRSPVEAHWPMGSALAWLKDVAEPSQRNRFKAWLLETLPELDARTRRQFS